MPLNFVFACNTRCFDANAEEVAAFEQPRLFADELLGFVRALSRK